MHQLKLDVIEESVNEIWVAVQTTSPVLVSNIRLRLRSHVNVAVLLGLSTAPSKEQLTKFADDGMLQGLASCASTINSSTHFFPPFPTVSAGLQRVQALPPIQWDLVLDRMKRGYPLEAPDTDEGMH